MRDLIQQEKFELEVLDRLNSKKLLNSLIFGGGTMLRLCFGLNRYSVDLDFWFAAKTDEKKLFKDIKEYFSDLYSVRDAANKHYTLLYELKSRDYPRSLKIEIRKEVKHVKTEKAIAYSKNSNIQVMLNVVSLDEMMKAKTEAFLDRKEVRDIFDIEFLLKKGIELKAGENDKNRMLKIMNSLTKRDYEEKLGSLLEAQDREYYRKENFKILKFALS